MPVRDLDSFFPSSGRRLRLLANRGANGIDGTVSSALGASIGAGEPAILLIGDIALLHDVGGVIAARRLPANLTIVCANNGGGGIFDHLPLAASADPAAYEEHVVTPGGIEIERVAALADMPYTAADTLEELGAAVARGPGLIEVMTDRALNVERHRELRARVAAAL